jgi:hypothetical protein
MALLRLRLIDDAGREFHRLWSIRVGLFFFVLNGALVGLAAFGDILNPLLFMSLNMGGYALIGIMRLTKQAPAVPTEPSTQPQEAAE